MTIPQDRVYHLRGTAFEIGRALGQSLGPRLAANVDRYIRARVPPDRPFDLARWRTGALPWLCSLPARFLEEFEGLAEGAQLPLQRLAEWAYLEVILSARCSAVIATLDHQVWVARNNDIFAPDMWGYATIREVTGRIPAISFGLEGDVFAPTGINREKLWLHYNYAPAWDAPPADSLPLPCYAFLVEALETCRTLQGLEALLARVPRDDGMLLFAVEGKTGAHALYECTCTGAHRREASGGWLAGTNHYLTHPQAPPSARVGTPSSLGRYDRMQVLVESFVSQGAKAPPVEALIRILADDAVEARQGETITAYANVACPATGELWYTFGGYPAASQGNWQRLPWPW